MVVWPKPCKSRSSPGALPQNPRPSAGVFLCPDNTPGNTPSRKPAIPANTRPRPPPATPATRSGEGVAELLPELLGELVEIETLVLRAQVLDFQRPHQ